MNTAEKLYARVCWVPLAGFGAAVLYARSFGGGGSWGAAGVVILPILLSILLLFVGVGLLITHRSAGQSRLPIALATVVAGSVFVVMAILFMLR